MTISTIFSQLLLYKKINTSDTENLKKYCYFLKEEDLTGNIVSNAGGWQSKSIPSDHEFYFKFKDLISQITDEVNIFCQTIGYSNLTLKVANLWANINCPGSYNHHHTHTGSIFSSVFYVDVPLNSGNIMFSNPYGNIKDAYLGNLHEVEVVLNSFTSSAFTLPPENNYLLVFPSWQEHWVNRNLSEFDRISIAINFEQDK
jgi:uncharacterized protein (TIGR02466 family)